MTVAERQRTPLSIPKFLASLPPEREHRLFELIEGHAVAMVGGKLRHSRIVMNFVRHLAPALRSNCELLTSEVFVASEERDDMLVVPDLMVRCGPADDSLRMVTDPSLIVEVLSPSTALLDRGVKLGFYQSLASVLQILLVYADERRVESWTRLTAPDEDGQHWRLTVSSDGDAVAFADFDLTLPLTAVYENTSLAS